MHNNMYVIFSRLWRRREIAGG